LGAFNCRDVRIDKKIDLKKFTIDAFLNVTNWFGARTESENQYSWERTVDNRTFKTTDGLAIKADGSNAIPTRLKDDAVSVIPTIGLIILF